MVLHIKMLISREFNFHILTVGEYKDKKKNEKLIKVKLFFYAGLLLFTFLR